MATAQPYLVQVEFYHVGGENIHSLGALLEECAQRIGENIPRSIGGSEVGPGIRTAVRFFDVTGGITYLARKANRAEKKRERSLEDYENASSWPRRWLMGIRKRWLIAQAHGAKDELRSFSSGRLQDALTMDSVAVENPDRSFRYVRDEEQQELIGRIVASTHVWVFVFNSNDLFSKKNELLVASM